MYSATLQDDPSVESFFNVVETETLVLFEHLFFGFLEEFDVFAPAETGRTREHEPPEMMRGFLHCYYHDIYGIRPVERELQNTVVWLSCGFDRPPSRDAVDRFLTDLEHVVDEVFGRLVEQAARRGLLDLTYCIDSTDVRAMPADQDAPKCYDPTAEEYYYGYGCTIVSTGQKIPIAAEFTESKQAPEETAMRVTRDALAVDKPIWMVGDSAYDTLDWQTTCWPQGSCQSHRTTRETPTIRKTSSTGSKTVSRNTARTFSSSNPSWTRRTTAARGLNEPTNQSRTAASGERTPEAAYTHERRCSSHFVCASWSQSPTTNAETIRGVP